MDGAALYNGVEERYALNPADQGFSKDSILSDVAEEKATTVVVQPKPLASCTAIVFDWDDTLLPSSWLAAEGLRLDYPERLPHHAVAQLRSLEALVVKILAHALEMGEVHILTNAESGWVELSAQRFMPAVVPYLSRLEVFSARSSYERAFPDSPLQWKVCAFKHTIGQVFNDRMDVDFGSSQMLNVISFGDSIHERDAVHEVTGAMRNTYTKSVKFVERPTMEQLQRQQELVISCFDYICGFSGDLDLMLTIQLLYS